MRKTLNEFHGFVSLDRVNVIQLVRYRRTLDVLKVR